MHAIGRDWPECVSPTLSQRAVDWVALQGGLRGGFEARRAQYWD
jgi:hypothetical protein